MAFKVDNCHRGKPVRFKLQVITSESRAIAQVRYSIDSLLLVPSLRSPLEQSIIAQTNASLLLSVRHYKSTGLTGITRISTTPSSDQGKVQVVVTVVAEE